LGTGFSVHYASNGEQGLARASELMPDLIITDIKMPYMDGLELCRRVRASRQLCHIPVIVLSARTSEEDRMRGFEAGADVYLVKPFNAVEIKLLATKLLENRNMLKKVYSKAQSTVLPQDTSLAVADHAPDDEDFLEAFTQLVEEQLPGGKSRLNLDLIAGRLKMGESQLKRRILELTGKNAVAYISQLRMEKAMRLLRERPNMLIGDVAEQCGFGDVAYFSRVFRQHYKMTPTEARKSDTLG
jgi:YesN/AraC family two-component response regulator